MFIKASPLKVIKTPKTKLSAQKRFVYFPQRDRGRQGIIVKDRRQRTMEKCKGTGRWGRIFVQGRVQRTASG